MTDLPPPPPPTPETPVRRPTWRHPLFLLCAGGFALMWILGIVANATGNSPTTTTQAATPETTTTAPPATDPPGPVVSRATCVPDLTPTLDHQDITGVEVKRVDGYYEVTLELGANAVINDGTYFVWFQADDITVQAWAETTGEDGHHGEIFNSSTGINAEMLPVPTFHNSRVGMVIDADMVPWDTFTYFAEFINDDETAKDACPGPATYGDTAQQQPFPG
jgi:hypothetical protein